MPKRILCLILTFAFSVMSASAAGVYTDSSATALLKSLNIMSGDENGNMNLDDAVTRAEFAKIAVNASKYKNSVALGAQISVFKDCTYTHWAAPYVKVAVTNGILTGYPDGTFRPEENVLYEEAITVALRLMGYTDDDFGASWPYGQASLAANLSLNKNVSKGIGEALSRRDVLALIYNMLTAKSKNSDSEYITTLDAKFYEDAVIIATNKEDTSVGVNSVLTSVGTFKSGDGFDSSFVGQKGDLAVKSSGEILAFMPYSQNSEKYVVYSVLANSVAVYANGGLTELNLSDNTTVYRGSDKYTFSSAKGMMSIGDVIHVVKDANGSVEYLTLKTDALEGAYTLSSYSDTWYTMFTDNDKNLTVMRDGVKVAPSSLKSLDILYYSPDLNTVFAYSKKITGVYDKAIPNKDTPTSVVISGTTYEIETTEAFNKLSSNGSLNYGDTVTLLFGKDGQIADVSPANSQSAQTLAGYLVKVGTKNFTNADGEEYSSRYADLIYPDGTEAEYAVTTDYSSYLNSVMAVTFASGTAKLSRVTGGGASGDVDADAMTVGKTKVSDEVKILDVSTTNKDHGGNAVSTFMVRLDGINLSDSSVLWCKKNTSGEIEELILKDVTGDSNEYGIVTSAPDKGDKGSAYTVDIAGSACIYSGGYYSDIKSGTPVKAEGSKADISALASLKAAKGSVTAVDATTVTAGGEKYTLSDKVEVYRSSGHFTYELLALSDLAAELDGDSYVTAYYDKAEKYGGRIRIITVK